MDEKYYSGAIGKATALLAINYLSVGTNLWVQVRSIDCQAKLNRPSQDEQLLLMRELPTSEM